MNNPSEQPFISHLLELRNRLLKTILVITFFLIFLVPFGNDLYTFIAEPLSRILPEGVSMISTGPVDPFLIPFKLSLTASLLLAIPFVLYQLWAFIAPGLYQHEKRLIVPVLASSVLLFYSGMVFAYFVVFPLIFKFMLSTTPDGVAMMTDIGRYLDLIMTLFIAFGFAFEVPIVVNILVWFGITTPDKLIAKRPYVIVGAFVIGMFLTPPDIISQTLLAIPMWLLFEIGVFFSRSIKNKRQEKKFPVETDYIPPTEAEMEAQLDQMDLEEQKFEQSNQDQASERAAHHLLLIQAYRDDGNVEQARLLCHRVLAEGNSDQRMVAQNILKQLDD